MLWERKIVQRRHLRQDQVVAVTTLFKEELSEDCEEVIRSLDR